MAREFLSPGLPPARLAGVLHASYGGRNRSLLQHARRGDDPKLGRKHAGVFRFADKLPREIPRPRMHDCGGAGRVLRRSNARQKTARHLVQLPPPSRPNAARVRKFIDSCRATSVFAIEFRLPVASPAKQHRLAETPSLLGRGRHHPQRNGNSPPFEFLPPPLFFFTYGLGVSPQIRSEAELSALGKCFETRGRARSWR